LPLDAFARIGSLDIQETVYNGKIHPHGKTKGSLKKVPIAKQLAKELTSWRQQCKHPSPEAFIFQGLIPNIVVASTRHDTVVNIA
jgi:hypothetical protein